MRRTSRRRPGERRRAEEATSQQIAELQAQQARWPPGGRSRRGGAADPMMAELQNLANLHTSGVLSDEEFAAAKAKLLGI